MFQLFHRGGAGKHENTLEAEVGSASDVGFHRVADHDRFVRGQAELLAGGPHHHGAGLADAERLNARRLFDQ